MLASCNGVHGTHALDVSTVSRKHTARGRRKKRRLRRLTVTPKLKSDNAGIRYLDSLWVAPITTKYSLQNPANASAPLHSTCTAAEDREN